MWGQAAGGIARVHACLFDMFHDARDVDVLAIGEGIDIHLDRAGEVAVEQHGVVAGNLHRLADVTL